MFISYWPRAFYMWTTFRGPGAPGPGTRIKHCLDPIKDFLLRAPYYDFLIFRS